MLNDQIQRKGKSIESCESSTTSNEMVNSIEYLSILLYSKDWGKYQYFPPSWKIWVFPAFLPILMETDVLCFSKLMLTLTDCYSPFWWQSLVINATSNWTQKSAQKKVLGLEMFQLRKFQDVLNLQFPSGLAKKREILIFSRTAGNTGISREINKIDS
jgi:hypothetical protein